MAILKCKMCGADLNIREGMTVCECDYCLTKQTVPLIDSDIKAKLFERANRLRMSCQFDKAAAIYESIINEFDTEAEGYWGNLLCKYGIEYVDDPITGNKVPTCHRSSLESFMDDENFEMVMENCDSNSRSVYREQAKQIEEIRKGIIEVFNKEEPYDIFICYKETSEDGQRTIDSVIAQDVYDVLVDRGYRVFFSRISLEDKLGTEYEPYIFAALNSAKVMLAFGTEYDYYQAVWVRNEWSRFLKLMAKDKSKYLIPCYKNIDAYDMPKEFAKFQAQDMGKVGAIQDLVRGIGKLLGDKKKDVVKENVDIKNDDYSEFQALLDRGYMALEDKEWDKADDFFEKVLNRDAKCADAYLGKLMAEIKVSSVNELKECDVPFDNSLNYQKVMRFGTEEIKRTFDNATSLTKSQDRCKTGDIISFGKYKWRVLDIKSDKALIITENAVEERAYNAESKDITWSSCSLRNWLNNDFYQSSFSAGEKARILSTRVIPGSNPEYNTNQGYETDDKVFLLNVNEVEQFFSEDNSRKCTYIGEPCWWWLRSSGYIQKCAAFVDDIGSIVNLGDFVNRDEYAVRPAMWINFES